MRALIQRVQKASVTVEGEVIGQIGPGLLVFVCAMSGDDDTQANALAIRLSKLRVFKDDVGKMNRSLLDTGGEALVVSQFTLAADTARGNRPGFSAAADPETGKRLYEETIKGLKQLGIQTQTGLFGANMQVSLINDGPVTLWLDV